MGSRRVVTRQWTGNARCVARLALPLLTGCHRLASIPSAPLQAAESWLTIQPYVTVRIASTSVVIVQPTTTAIVFVLGLIAIGIGLHVLRSRTAHRSRLWWGIALLLWGLGALLAGTSYEAFSYQIKCVGRDVCTWTSWWEIAYLVVTVASVNAIIVAQAYSSAHGALRRMMIRYAIAHCAAYVAVIAAGIALASRTLLSFELFVAVVVPGFVLLAIQNVWNYRARRRSLDLALLGAWAGLALTVIAYALYLASGLSATLWSRGLWFTENDVLHLGLIAWMVYLAIVVAPRVEDEPAATE